MHVDNRSLVEAVYSTKQVHDRHSRIDIGAFKELLNKEVKQIKWTPGFSQLANCLTKRSASGRDLLNTLQFGHIPY